MSHPVPDGKSGAHQQVRGAARWRSESAPPTPGPLADLETGLTATAVSIGKAKNNIGQAYKDDRHAKNFIGQAKNRPYRGSPVKTLNSGRGLIGATRRGDGDFGASQENGLGLSQENGLSPDRGLRVFGVCQEGRGSAEGVQGVEGGLELREGGQARGPDVGVQGGLQECKRGLAAGVHRGVQIGVTEIGGKEGRVGSTGALLLGVGLQNYQRGSSSVRGVKAGGVKPGVAKGRGGLLGGLGVAAPGRGSENEGVLNLMACGFSLGAAPTDN